MRRGPPSIAWITVRIRGRDAPVEIANLPDNSLGEAVLRDLVYCHPTYECLTTGDDTFPMSDIVAIVTTKRTTVGNKTTTEKIEKPYIVSVDGEPAEFVPYQTLIVHSGEPVEIANVPQTTAGLSLMRRLTATDKARFQKTYGGCSLYYRSCRSADRGWIPIHQLDRTNLGPDPDASPDDAPDLRANDFADGGGYETHTPAVPVAVARAQARSIRKSGVKLGINQRRSR